MPTQKDLANWNLNIIEANTQGWAMAFIRDGQVMFWPFKDTVFPVKLTNDPGNARIIAHCDIDIVRAFIHNTTGSYPIFVRCDERGRLPTNHGLREEGLL